jgi:hypothetical protein
MILPASFSPLQESLNPGQCLKGKEGGRKNIF